MKYIGNKNIYIGISQKKDGSMKSDFNKRLLFFKKLGLDKKIIVSADLVHKNRVMIVDDVSESSVISKCDALISNNPKHLLSLTVADCLPIYFFDKNKSVIALAHAGWRSIQTRLLNDRGLTMNHKRIVRIMRKYHLFVKIRTSNPYKLIAKKTQEHRICDNKLSREFKQEIPLRVFCTDITYLFYNRRVAYLSVVKDICSGEIVSWHLSNNLSMSVVLSTIDNLKQNNNLPLSSFENIMIHSDQGFHYTNPEYIREVKNLNMIQSMSRKGNCIDNSPIESFFGHLKGDVDYRKCKTFAEVHSLIEGYMNYYNNERYQWDLKKMTPVQYRNHLLSLV